MIQQALHAAHSLDNVVTAVDDILAGTAITVTLDGCDIALTVLDDVPFGCMVAIRDIPRGRTVLRGGARVGGAIGPVRAGQRVDA
jgi:hypothetical protein